MSASRSLGPILTTLRANSARFPQNSLARYFVPDAMKDYFMFGASSTGSGFGAIVSGAGGRSRALSVSV